MRIPHHHFLQPHPVQRRVPMPAPPHALVAARGPALKAHERARLVLQELFADHAVNDRVAGGRALGGEFSREAFGAVGGDVLAQDVGDGVADAEFHA